jgi:hypothetical protein
MLEMVNRSACKPAPPLGSDAEKVITKGNDSDMIWDMGNLRDVYAFYPI